MNLKIGGSNVGKIMYNGQEFGGASKLEPGTIVYMSETLETDLRSVHLLSTTKNWNNINGINVRAYNTNFSINYVDVDIPSDDFKNFDIKKSYGSGTPNESIHISTSIVDGEYRINVASYYAVKSIIKAI